ncbi:MAG TPA: dephospho-CoA kinase [Bacteroidales bacterium]|jgi:dephospho-CoA kinase|nr:dephospho-CoA kinase [Bacteroidales bacterium]HBZ22522.1 dephospho-CoA kinase [Bacteroidales bacterium]
MNRNGVKRLKLGVTGGIGSGKTTVCKVFGVLGIPVFSADEEAKKLLDTDKDIQIEINRLAGMDLFSSGKLDRPVLAKIIFNNRHLLEKVNSIIHPAVFRSFGDWFYKQDSPYSIMEAAILFESGADRFMDRIVTVVTPLEERIERLVKGNRFSRDQVIERIKNQIDDESRVKLSDFVIYNSENNMIIPAIIGIHEEMLKLSKKN